MRKRHHVKLSALGFELGEPPGVVGGIEGVVQVRHHIGIRENGLGGFVTGIVELYESGEFLSFSVIIQLSGGIKHAPARFIANLNPLHFHANVL